ISALFLYLSFRSILFDELAEDIVKVNLGIMLLFEIGKLVTFSAAAFRAKLLLSPLYDYPFWRLLKAHFLLFVSNNVLPFRMGELLRVHYLARHGQQSHSSCLAVAIVERLLDLTFLFLILLFVVLLADRIPLSWSIYFVIAGVLGGVAAAFFIGRYPDKFVSIFGRMASLFGDTVANLVKEKLNLFAGGLAALTSLGKITLIMVLSASFWIPPLATFWAWVWAWDMRLPWYAPATILLYASLGTAIPSSPGYVGTFHYFVVLALERFGVDRTRSVSFAIVGHAVTIIPFTLFAILALFRDQVRGQIVSWRAIRGQTPVSQSE
ncbi:MAG: lysylphosphatidylglycerol synthase transmembrane domain-containing protein, partial [Pseudomonadota bacterium]